MYPKPYSYTYIYIYIYTAYCPLVAYCFAPPHEDVVNIIRSIAWLELANDLAPDGVRKAHKQLSGLLGQTQETTTWGPP